MLAMKRPCKKEDAAQKASFNSPEVKTINKDYAEFFKMVTDKTGLDLKENAFRDMWRAADALYCEVGKSVQLFKMSRQLFLVCCI